MNVDHGEFTEVRLEALSAAGRALPANTAFADVKEALGNFVGEAKQSDDITCMVLRHAHRRRDNRMSRECRPHAGRHRI